MYYSLLIESIEKCQASKSTSYIKSKVTDNKPGDSNNHQTKELNHESEYNLLSNVNTGQCRSRFTNYMICTFTWAVCLIISYFALTIAIPDTTFHPTVLCISTDFLEAQTYQKFSTKNIFDVVYHIILNLLYSFSVMICKLFVRKDKLASMSNLGNFLNLSCKVSCICWLIIAIVSLVSFSGINIPDFMKLAILGSIPGTTVIHPVLYLYSVVMTKRSNTRRQKLMERLLKIKGNRKDQKKEKCENAIYD